MDRGDQAEIRLRVWLQSRKAEDPLIWHAGLLLRRFYLFRFSLLASTFVFTHASSVPRLAELTPDDFKSVAGISGTIGAG
jgi:hypothetical protein